MLKNIIIRNIVLIEKLDLNLEKGLCVLTGETGSGKSILLDALGLALGGKSSSRLLRDGETQGSVIAEFDIENNKPAQELLNENEIDFDESLLIKRTIGEDGKSKAFINNEPVSQNLLAKLGSLLLEIHGQGDQLGLLNPVIHRNILDEFGKLDKQKSLVSEAYDNMKKTMDELSKLKSEEEDLKREIDYLSHVLNELQEMQVEVGEESELNEKRIALMNREKILDVLSSVKNEIEGNKDIGKAMRSAQNSISRSVGLGANIIDGEENSFEPIVDSFEDALISLEEASKRIDYIARELSYNNSSLEEVEERLFAIRGLARKFKIDSDSLPEFEKEISKKLDACVNSEIRMGNLDKELEEQRSIYIKEAEKLSKERIKAGAKLSKLIEAELKPLKMERAVFNTEIIRQEEGAWSRNGMDGVKFVASLNPGSKPDSIAKIASGGELSRFMLAMKVVLSEVKSVPSLIFDEIDTGIGGAVANAVGERLKKLGSNLQVLVVTHQAQVASKGNYHIRVRKEVEDEKTNTYIDILKGEEIEKEIARMLSGEDITKEAIEAAKKLMA